MANILRKQNQMIGGFADANKIDTDAGTFEDAEHNTYTGITTDMISYDATNNQLLLKVGGADSVIPFSRGSKLVDINPEKSTLSGKNYLAFYVGSTEIYDEIPICGYDKIALYVNDSSNLKVRYCFKYLDGSYSSWSNYLSLKIWSDYIQIPDNIISVRLGLQYSSTTSVAIYYSMLTKDSPYNPDNQEP